VHERDASTEQYVKHISQLLLGPGIRLHIREVVMAWIAGAREPLEDEWGVLEKIDHDPSNPVRDMLWRALYGKDRWFTLLRSVNEIQRMLSHSERARVDLGVHLLRGVQRSCPDQ